MKKSFITKLMSMILLAALVICSVPATASAEDKDDHLKILFLGNSYSDDITDGGYFEDSMLYNIMKSMVGDNCKITIGLLWSGGVTMGWHASAAEKNTEMSFFHASDTSKWTYAGAYTTTNAMKFTDWDIVVLQPYGLEMSEDYSAPVSGLDNKFMKVSASAPYMLDFIAKNIPGAKAYLYLPMLSLRENTIGAGLSDFRTYAKNAVTISGYKGTESSLGFSGVIPVGTAVQAARGTYLGALGFNKDIAVGTAYIETTDDPNFGLQRDTVHLSFSIGRYIANLTAAETLIPKELRLSSYELPAMRPSDAIGALPEDYREIAIMAVDAAMESVSASNKYVPRPISGLTEDPLATAAKALDGAEIIVGEAKNEEELKGFIAEAIKETTGLDLTVNVTLTSEYKAPTAEGESFNVGFDITYAHGYSGSAEKKGMNVRVEYGYGAVENPFADVKEGEWYYEGVMYAYSHGYMKGTNADMTAFSPSMEFTREQFVQLLFNMEGLDAADYAGDTGFSDVPAGQWYSAAVKWAAEAGVTSGIGGGKFGLGGKVTREQLAKFLMNYAEMRDASTEARADLSAYSDAASVSDWATDAVAFAVAEGLIGSTSTSAKVLSPGRVAVRSEIAKITMSFDAYLTK